MRVSVWSIWGGGQNLERRNVQQLIFRNFKIANIKVTKDELFIGFFRIYFFIFYKWAGGRNFDRANVERPIFQNFKIANVKSYARSSYSIFYLRNYFFFFFKLFKHSNFGFFTPFYRSNFL